MKHTGRRLFTAALLAFAVAGAGETYPTLAAGPPLEAVGATTLAQTVPPPLPVPVSTISYFGCNGGLAQYYTVPANTSWLAITAWGGSGVSVTGASGGLGAAVNAKVQVTPGQRLAVNVGCAGGVMQQGGAGFAQGGNGGTADLDVKPFGGGGGGASGVQLCPGSNDCNRIGAQQDILVVAGGGGGGGGKSVTGNGGNGGSGSATGDKGQSGDACSLFCSSASGGGGGGSQQPNGANGWGTTDSGAGGGGGGGYPKGGDGGRGGSCVGCGGGGGGGGASYKISTASDVKITDGGALRGNGVVILTPVRPTQPVPPIGAFGCSTGKLQTYTVPFGVTSIAAVAIGAAGGLGDNVLGGVGGAGAVITSVLDASSGQQFGVLAGCSNGGNSGSGYGSGGRGGANNLGDRAGGGGGGSAVLSAPTMSADPLLVAGGGGGAGDGQFSGSGGYGPAGLNGSAGQAAPLGSGGSAGLYGAAGGRDGSNGQGSDCAHGGGGGGGGYPKGGGGGHSGGCVDGPGGGGGAGQSFVSGSVKIHDTTPGAGSSAGAVLMIAAVPGPPMAPTNVVATGTDSGATITWTLPADNGGTPITSYTVRSTPGNISFPVGAAKLGPVVFAGLTNGTQYTFTVVATNAVGDSAVSTPSNPVTPRPFPGQPAITSVTAGDGQATVAFNPPTIGAPFISYTVTARSGGQISGPAITATGTTSPVTITGLTNGTSYVLSVYATNSSGNGPESPLSGVTPLGLPGAPTNIQASASNATAMVSFTPPANTGGAQFLRYTVTSNPGGITTTVNGSPAQLSGLTNGVAYTFTVYASNAAGNGPASTPSNVVTPTANVTPSAPLLPRATAGDGSATVTFQAPLSDGGTPITSYKVISNPAGITATGAASPITVTGLTNGTSYTFTVVATNAVGDSQPSDATNAVTPNAATIPSQPGAPVAFPSNDGALVRVSRPSSDGFSPITSYTVTSNPSGISAIGYGDANPVAVTGLTNGVSYTFTVVATNALGNSVPSAASNAIVPSGSLAPANDNFNNAQVVTGDSASLTGTNVNATTETGEPGPGGASVWYAWNVTHGGVVQIDTCGSSFTPSVVAYTGSAVNALTPLGSSPVGVFCNGTFISGIQVALPPNGGIIYIAVDGGTPSSPVTGDFNLHWGQGG